MGEVYRARDVALGREVAIKTLPDFVFAEPNRLARFEQEAKAAPLSIIPILSRSTSLEQTRAGPT